MAEEDSADIDNIYQNVTVNIDEVKEIDERIVSFMRIVHEAPQSVKDSTQTFLRSIDELKQIFIGNIVKCKKIEKKYEEATTNLYLCQKEYESFQKNYLVQVGPDISEAEEKVEKRKLELEVAAKCLQNAERELLFSKEKLYRVSKKSEHEFIGILKNNPDNIWFQRYTKKLINVDDDTIYHPLHGRVEPMERQYKPYGQVENDYDVISRDVMSGNEILGDDELYAEVYPIKKDAGENNEEDEKKLIDFDEDNNDPRMLPGDTTKPEDNGVAPVDHSLKPIDNVIKPDDNDVKPVDKPDTVVVSPEFDSLHRRERGTPADEMRSYEGEKYRPLKTSPKTVEKNKKKKKVMNFFQKRIHGPWEGWDED